MRWIHIDNPRDDKPLPLPQSYSKEWSTKTSPRFIGRGGEVPAPVSYTQCSAQQQKKVSNSTPLGPRKEQSTCPHRKQPKEPLHSTLRFTVSTQDTFAHEVKCSLCETHRGCLRQTTLTSGSRGFASTTGSSCIWTWTSWSTLPFASVTRWMTGEASMDSLAIEDTVSVLELQDPARDEPRGEMHPSATPCALKKSALEQEGPVKATFVPDSQTFLSSHLASR